MQRRVGAWLFGWITVECTLKILNGMGIIQICTFVVWERYNLFSQFAYTLRNA